MSGQVSFAPSQADYVAATRGHYLALIRSRRWLIKITTVLALLVAVATAFVAFIDGEVGSFPAIMLPLAMLTAATCISLNLLWLPRKIRRLFTQQSLYGAEAESAWSDLEFSNRSPVGTSVLQWGQFIRWREMSKSFLFYLSDASYLFLPKRVLDDDQVLDLRRCAGVGVARHPGEGSP
ncbi:MAG: YcxB family protein [Sphingomonas sp.]